MKLASSLVQIFLQNSFFTPKLEAGLFELKTVWQFFRPLISKHIFSELAR